MNETIDDIFSIQAREVLHKKGIYILEPKEHINEDVKDCNTHSIVKKCLAKFIVRYRAHIIRARILGDMQGLYDIVGEENFEELNDVVNKVDSLPGLAYELKDGMKKSPIVQEYYKQLERLERIYANMEEHELKVKQSKQLVSRADSEIER